MDFWENNTYLPIPKREKEKKYVPMQDNAWLTISLSYSRVHEKLSCLNLSFFFFLLTVQLVAMCLSPLTQVSFYMTNLCLNIERLN